jgi:ankyrin repeat protein
MQGYREIVDLMVTEGANVKIRDSYKATILHYVAITGHTSTAQVLIDNGAEVDAKAKTVPGSTLREGLLLGNGITPLHVAAAYGRADLVEVLIAKGADVNAKTQSSTAPLHLAVAKGHTNVVKILIGARADVNCKSRNGTPLHIAVKRGYEEIANLLRQHGAVE